MDDDRIRWDRRYVGGTSNDPIEPAAPEALTGRPRLLDAFPTSGRAADLACGLGSVTLWMADRGLHVTALDASHVAIERLRSAASAQQLTGRVDARPYDLDDGLPEEVDELDALVCQRFRDPSLYPLLLGRLRTKGILCVSVLSQVGAAPAGRFRAPAGELRRAFDDERADVLHHHEGDGLEEIVVRRG